MRLSVKILSFVYGLFAATSLHAADWLPDSTYRYSAEVTASFSSGSHTPFWLVNNRFGLSSLEKNSGYVRAGLFKEMKYDRRFSWDFGVDLAAAWNYSSSFIVQQLYAGVRYRCLDLTIGSKERQEGLINHSLGSGDMLFSENSRPIPQIYLSVPEYQFIPGTKRWLAARGYFSFGRYTDGDWSERIIGPNHLYNVGRWQHTKGLFLRLGDPDRHQFSFEGGLEMGCQFGGTLYATDEHGNKVVKTKFHTGLKDLIKVVIPLGGGDTNDPVQSGELTNALGNHVGQWSAAVGWRSRDRQWGARLYYQHFFDDHSMLFFDHAWRDMLLGLELKFPDNRFVSTFVYEYLITKDQSGPVYWDATDKIPEQVSGADDYYNHIFYGNWQHWGMGLGNPLVISPIYNADGSLFFRHNRIKGHHWGWEGDPHPDLHYRVLMSYTRSWGSYFFPTPDIVHNFNALVELTYAPHQLPGWSGRVSFGADGGRLLGKSVGVMVTISKKGWL